MTPLECGIGEKGDMTQDGEQLKEITSTTMRPTRAAATRARQLMQKLLSSEIGTFSWGVSRSSREKTGN